MKIAIGNDNHGFTYKKMLIETFAEHQFVDVGSNNTDPIRYPGIAEKVVELVLSRQCERGILICGTGIGMAITANKFKGCYAAVCHDIYSAQRAILSNNANILCMGALVIGTKTCLAITKEWISQRFDPQSHSAANITMIQRIEQTNLGHTVDEESSFKF